MIKVIHCICNVVADSCAVIHGGLRFGSDKKLSLRMCGDTLLNQVRIYKC